MNRIASPPSHCNAAESVAWAMGYDAARNDIVASLLRQATDTQSRVRRTYLVRVAEWIQDDTSATAMSEDGIRVAP